jgi:hypothetical protein
MVESTLFPYLDYSDLGDEGSEKKYRLFGTLEAIRARDQIWINSGDFSVAADLHHVPVYILPSISLHSTFETAFPEEQPQSIPWKQISSLPGKTPIFIAGTLTVQNEQPEFKSRSKEPLLVVLYDGDRQSLLKRGIWGGRQSNEYWNQFTLISLITGSMALVLLSYILSSNSIVGLSFLLSFALSLSPLAPLLPPGVLFLLLYRYFWKKARVLRAERDLQRLPLRYFRQKINIQNEESVITQLPDGQSYVMIRGSRRGMEGKIAPGDVISEPPLTVLPSGNELYLFGARSGEFVVQPEDAMAERVLIRGNPELNAQKCSVRARTYELLSAAFFALDIIPNFFLILLILRYLVH